MSIRQIFAIAVVMVCVPVVAMAASKRLPVAQSVGIVGTINSVHDYPNMQSCRAALTRTEKIAHRYEADFQPSCDPVNKLHKVRGTFSSRYDGQLMRHDRFRTMDACTQWARATVLALNTNHDAKVDLTCTHIGDWRAIDGAGHIIKVTPPGRIAKAAPRL